MMHLETTGVKKCRFHRPPDLLSADILNGMPAVIGFLRGVNVVGNNKIKMEELRALCESMGLLNAQTYIQSGNVVFRMKGRSVASLAARIEKAIEMQFGFRPHVMLRTAEELRDVITRNPFARPSRFE